MIPHIGQFDSHGDHSILIPEHFNLNFWRTLQHVKQSAGSMACFVCQFLGNAIFYVNVIRGHATDVNFWRMLFSAGHCVNFGQCVPITDRISRDVQSNSSVMHPVNDEGVRVA